jgi:ATP-dependent RNA helicase DOB1
VYDPVEFIKDRTHLEEYKKLSKQRDSLLQVLQETVDKKDIDNYKKRIQLLENLQLARDRMDGMQRLADQKDLDAMVEVLKKLNFLSSDGIVTMKGKIASTITAGNELVVTELLLTGLLEKLSPEGLAALFSCFVNKPSSQKEEKDEEREKGVPDELSEGWKKILTIAKTVASVSFDVGVDIDVEKFKREFDAGMMDLTLAWASGSGFAQIMESFPGNYEGNVVRTMKRLGELLGQGARAAGVAENEMLKGKFEAAGKCIERGIVFTASLYL